jgi:hypothetical protein
MEHALSRASELVTGHCIIHQQWRRRMQCVQSNLFNLGQSQTVSKSADNGGVLHHSGLRWLGRVRVLNGSTNMKGTPLLEFSDDDRISDLFFLTDMRQHQNDIKHNSRETSINNNMPNHARGF